MDATGLLQGLVVVGALNWGVVSMRAVASGKAGSTKDAVTPLVGGLIAKMPVLGKRLAPWFASFVYALVAYAAIALVVSKLLDAPAVSSTLVFAAVALALAVLSYVRVGSGANGNNNSRANATPSYNYAGA